jgi:hypothetical protein
MTERGDKFASGATSGVIPHLAPIKFNEGEMRDDLKKISSQEFMVKYLITQMEYDILTDASEEKKASFAEQIKQRAETVERELAIDDAEEAKWNRKCDFLTPFHPIGLSGCLLVSYDKPVKYRSQSGIILAPRSQRKDRTLLPTTGHVMRAAIWDERIVVNPQSEPNVFGGWVSAEWIGKRVLFNQMSGSAICFNKFPTWIRIEISEVLCIVDREDIDVIEEPLEPMV